MSRDVVAAMTAYTLELREAAIKLNQNEGPTDFPRELKEQDPAVQIGRFSVKVIPWMVPAGAMSFSPTRFPRSVAEAEA